MNSAQYVLQNYVFYLTQPTCVCRLRGRPKVTAAMDISISISQGDKNNTELKQEAATNYSVFPCNS